MKRVKSLHPILSYMKLKTIPYFVGSFHEQIFNSDKIKDMKLQKSNLSVSEFRKISEQNQSHQPSQMGKHRNFNDPENETYN